MRSFAFPRRLFEGEGPSGFNFPSALLFLPYGKEKAIFISPAAVRGDSAPSGAAVPHSGQYAEPAP
jgi:hypothetical protein